MEQQDQLRKDFERFLEENYKMPKADQFPEELEVRNEEFVVIEEWING